MEQKLFHVSMLKGIMFVISDTQGIKLDLMQLCFGSIYFSTVSDFRPPFYSRLKSLLY